MAEQLLVQLIGADHPHWKVDALVSDALGRLGPAGLLQTGLGLYHQQVDPCAGDGFTHLLESAEMGERVLVHRR